MYYNLIVCLGNMWSLLTLQLLRCLFLCFTEFYINLAVELDVYSTPPISKCPEKFPFIFILT